MLKEKKNYNSLFDYNHSSLRIEICGGIASGKTTLARMLDKIKFDIIYEDFKKSPFWEAFYCNPGKYIFETEISFILLHYYQIKIALEESKNHLICDFSFVLDHAFAKIGMSGSKLEAFEMVLKEIRKELPQPNLMVYLKCDAKTELERIRKRARAEESSINIEFLDSLNKALEKELGRVQNSIPVITIDSSEKDFVKMESTKAAMINLIKDFLSSK